MQGRQSYLVCSIILTGLLTPLGAHAYTEPFYAWVQVAGDMDDPAAFDVGTVEGPNTVYAERGRFWCETSDGSCGISIAPGAGGGAGVARVDPFAGTIQAKAGAFNYPDEERVHWTVDLGFGSFEFYPTYWKSGSAATYLRNVWRVESDTLAVGTPVTIEASLNLHGVLEGGPTASYGAAMLVNTRSATNAWLSGYESITLDTARDLLNTPGLLVNGRETGGHAIAGMTDVDVDTALTWQQTFAVGDVIVVETMLNTFAGAANVGGSADLFYVWSKFDQTLTSGISAITPGITLAPVPEAQTWAMLLAGLGMLGWWRGRRHNMTA